MCFLFNALNAQNYKVRLFNEALFYDGYKKDTVMKTPAPAGVIRFSTSLFSTKISDAQLDSIGDSLTLKVLIKASCDNYDRIGNVNLAFIPKGDTIYKPDTLKNRIEIGRFITPFMNKNVKPDTVPYIFEIHNISKLLRDKTLRKNYDVWCELSVFGVSSAAQTQVSGCSGRYDVFFGTVDFLTNSNYKELDSTLLVPLGVQLTFNNYKVGASDTIGVSAKTISFTLLDSLKDTKMVLITSNHGANTGGEEYNRREHFIFFDDNLILQYTPGDTSCEPFRKYNTQGNGIYGSTKRTNAEWQSFSNWCPGSKIPNREISLGNLSKGTHKFKINVPDAIFTGAQGNFPLSIYIQGVKAVKKTTNSISQNHINNIVEIYPNPTSSMVHINTDIPLKKVEIYNPLGKKLLSTDESTIDISNFANGLYFINVYLKDETSVTRQITLSK